MNVDALADEIIKQIKTYSEETDKKIKNIITTTAKEALEAAKSAGSYKDRGRGYRQKFVLKREQKEGSYKVTLHNKQAGVTHLLEYGHATSNGGRTKAYPHWKEAQAIAESIEERIKNEL